MEELKMFDWQIMMLARTSLAPHSDLVKFVEIVCAQKHPRRLYELLMEFYLAREACVVIPILEQRLAQFEPEKSEERFAL